MIDDYLWNSDKFRVIKKLDITVPHGGDESITRQTSAEFLRSYRLKQEQDRMRQYSQSAINQRGTFRWHAINNHSITICGMTGFFYPDQRDKTQ
jgi:hypothetical protein